MIKRVFILALLLFYWSYHRILKRYLDQIPDVDPITEEFGRDEIIEVPRQDTPVPTNWNTYTTGENLTPEVIIIVQPMFQGLMSHSPMVHDPMLEYLTGLF